MRACGPVGCPRTLTGSCPHSWWPHPSWLHPAVSRLARLPLLLPLPLPVPFLPFLLLLRTNCSGWVGMMAVGIKWLNLVSAELFLGSALGVVWGIGLAVMYQLTKKRKAERGQLVRAGRGTGPRARARQREQAGVFWSPSSPLYARRSAAPFHTPPACAIAALARTRTCSRASACPTPLPARLPAPQLAVIPGAKGMQELLHNIPTWISFRDTEKMEVGQGVGVACCHGGGGGMRRATVLRTCMRARRRQAPAACPATQIPCSTAEHGMPRAAATCSGSTASLRRRGLTTMRLSARQSRWGAMLLGVCICAQCALTLCVHTLCVFARGGTCPGLLPLPLRRWRPLAVAPPAGASGASDDEVQAAGPHQEDLLPEADLWG